MDDEIMERLLEKSMETPEEAPEPDPGEELEAARQAIAALEREKQDLETARDAAVVDYAARAAVAASGARDPELLELLLRQEGLTLEDGQVPGLSEAIDRQRRNRPWLFADGGDRPRFAAPVMGRDLGKDDKTVAERYRGNPWYSRA